MSDGKQEKNARKEMGGRGKSPEHQSTITTRGKEVKHGKKDARG